MTPDPATVQNGIDSLSWLRVILAFVIVGGLLAGLGFGLHYLSMRGIKLPGGGLARNRRRLQLAESLPLDARRRLVICRCDGREYLLLLGTGQDIVVAALPPSAASPEALE